MSRSKKKIPKGWVSQCSAGVMKKWKKQGDRLARRTNEEIPSGNYYRKKFRDIWSSPSDGRTWLIWRYEDKWEQYGK